MRPIVAYYYEWIKSGKLKVRLTGTGTRIKFTVQDPCNQIRKSFGDAQADKMRDVVKACVGAENFEDMSPDKSKNFCCGGGGGYLQSGYTMKPASNSEKSSMIRLSLPGPIIV